MSCHCSIPSTRKPRPASRSPARAPRWLCHCCAKNSRGAIQLRRPEVRPFSEKQIALLKTFADQAAIAIENVRLFNELKDSLDQQTATSDVLRVIAGSPTELQPVLDAVTESAVKLAGAKHGHIRQYDGEFLRWVASYGDHPSNLPCFKPPFVLARRVDRVVRSWSEGRSMMWMPKWNVTRWRLRPELERPWRFRCCVRRPRSESLRFGAMLSNRLPTGKSNW